MYYQLEVDIKQSYGIVKWPKFPEQVSFKKGVLITQSLSEPIVFEVSNTSEIPPSDLPGLVIPVFSNRAINLLGQAKVDNFQIFSVKLINLETNDIWNEYKAVNIFGSISCADLQSSKYDEIISGLYDFDELVISKSKAKNNMLFRLSESPHVIIVHETLVAFLKENADPKLSGFYFEKLDVTD